jgi:alcohol dehydrogenase (cytochrome c)
MLLVTCALRWRHNWEYKARTNWPQSRGVALKAGTIVRARATVHLLAIDADTGRLLWERAIGDADRARSAITMPPLIFEDLVIMGPAGGGADQGMGRRLRAAGRRPGGGSTPCREPASPAQTRGTDRRADGGSAVWTRSRSIPPRGWCTSRPGIRRRTSSPTCAGANLYTNSLVVPRRANGKLVWHHQATPHDLHDWDLARQASSFSRVDVGGKPRRLVSIVGKDGLLRILTARVVLRSRRSQSRAGKTSRSR